MTSVFLALTAIAMFITLATLVVGLASMTKGGDFNQKYGQKLMRLRVMAQGAALVFFSLWLMSKQ